MTIPTYTLNLMDLPKGKRFKLLSIPQHFRLRSIKGPFAGGRMAYRANELARINIPADLRNELGALYKAPWLKNGMLVRITGLWSQQKLPFKVWPVEASLSEVLSLYDWADSFVNKGMEQSEAYRTVGLAGVHMQPEWLVKVPLEDQDQLYVDTCNRVGITDMNTEVVAPDPPFNMTQGMVDSMFRAMAFLADKSGVTVEELGASMGSVTARNALLVAVGERVRTRQGTRKLAPPLDYLTALTRERPGPESRHVERFTRWVQSDDTDALRAQILGAEHEGLKLVGKDQWQVPTGAILPLAQTSMRYGIRVMFHSECLEYRDWLRLKFAEAGYEPEVIAEVVDHYYDHSGYPALDKLTYGEGYEAE